MTTVKIGFYLYNKSKTMGVFVYRFYVYLEFNIRKQLKVREDNTKYRDTKSFTK